MQNAATGERTTRLSRRSIIAAVVLATILVLGAVAFFGIRAAMDPGPPVTGVTEIAVGDDYYEPSSIQIPVGETVTWTWEGEDEHDIVGDGLYTPLQIDGEYVYTFDEAGEYDYLCTEHTFMRGRVIVTDE